MAFTVNDLQDLTRLLIERPEWLSEVRRIVLTDELLALPREVAEAQRRTDERFAELVEIQRRNEEQLAELRRQTDARFAELTEAIRQLTLCFGEAQQRNEDRSVNISDLLLKMRYRDKVGAIFGGRRRRPRVVDGGDVWELLRDHLDEGEIRRIVAADLIVRGGLLPPQGEGELWLVVEVSRVIDRNDVARAAERAALLRKAGLLVMPVAAGKRFTRGALTLSEEFGVTLARDGALAGWDVYLLLVWAVVEPQYLVKFCLFIKRWGYSMKQRHSGMPPTRSRTCWALMDSEHTTDCMNQMRLQKLKRASISCMVYFYG